MRLIPVTLAISGLSIAAAFAGGGKVTSTEPGPPTLSEQTTGQVLETMGIETVPVDDKAMPPIPAMSTPAAAAGETVEEPTEENAVVEESAEPSEDSPQAESAEAEEQPAEEDVEVADAEPIDPRKAIRQCTTCHGVDGLAKIPTAPNIAGSSRVYLETQLKAFRSGARENEVMSVIAEGMSDAQITATAQWYSALNVTSELPE